MKSPEHFEEVTIKRGCVGNSRVAKQQSEDRTERRPEHHRRENRRYPGAVDLFHHRGDQEGGFGVLVPGNKLSPGNHPNNRKIDGQINNGHGNHTDDDRARYGPARILYLIADVTDVVITEIVVDADARGGAESEKESERESKRTWRKIKSAGRAEMHCSGYYHCERSQQSSNP